MPHLDDAQTDIYSPAKRREIMRRVRSRDTTPELLMRSALHRIGYRFRLYARDLAGRPDLVLPRFRTVIFVNGCFWHQHRDCSKSALPKKNAFFWEAKLQGNVMRDKANHDALLRGGWNVLTVWECEIKKNLESVIARVDSILRDLEK